MHGEGYGLIQEGTKLLYDYYCVWCLNFKLYFFNPVYIWYDCKNQKRIYDWIVVSYCYDIYEWGGFPSSTSVCNSTKKWPHEYINTRDGCLGCEPTSLVSCLW